MASDLCETDDHIERDDLVPSAQRHVHVFREDLVCTDVACVDNRAVRVVLFAHQVCQEVADRTLFPSDDGEPGVLLEVQVAHYLRELDVQLLVGFFSVLCDLRVRWQVQRDVKAGDRDGEFLSELVQVTLSWLSCLVQVRSSDQFFVRSKLVPEFDLNQTEVLEICATFDRDVVSDLFVVIYVVVATEEEIDTFALFGDQLVVWHSHVRQCYDEVAAIFVS